MTEVDRVRVLFLQKTPYVLIHDVSCKLDNRCQAKGLGVADCLRG
jgi:hypothetical protein